jgi:hypothetical protein
MKKSKSLKALNEIIGKRFPHVFLERGEGYFYIASNDRETGNRIGALYQSGIYMSDIEDLTIDEWIKEVEKLFSETNSPDVTAIP